MIRPGTTALITGASGGIGAEFTAQLADREVDLVLVARNTDRLAEVRDVLNKRKPRVRIDLIEADLSTPQSGAEISRQVALLDRHIDVLINNAGAGIHGDF